MIATTFFFLHHDRNEVVDPMPADFVDRTAAELARLRRELKSRFPLGRGYRRGVPATTPEASGEQPTTTPAAQATGLPAVEQSTSWRTPLRPQKLAEADISLYRQLGCRVTGLWWAASVQLLADLGIRRGRRPGI